MIDPLRLQQISDVRPPQLGEQQKSPFLADKMVESFIQGGPQSNNSIPAQMWNEREQNWLTMSYNMNLMGFANYDLFKSANIDLQQSPNPVQCVLCFFFKGIILILYFITPYYQTVVLYEIIVILGAVDFWIIKNVCGRVLVGLRWWVEIDEKDKERWVFETRLTDKGSIQRIHSRVFWFIQLFMFFMFAGMFIINTLSLSFSVSICMMFPAIFTGFNLWAFNMCNKVKKSRLGQEMMQSSVGRRSIKLPMKMN